MKKKIIGILVMTLLIASVFGSMNSTTAQKISTSIDDSTTEESSQNSEGLNIQQDPENPGERPLVFTPPWDIAEFDSDKQVEWVADASVGDTGITSYYGYAGKGGAENDFYASAGLPYGDARVKAWFDHGFNFQAPVTDTYIFTFKYSVIGVIIGIDYGDWGGKSYCKNTIRTKFIAGSEEVTETVIVKEHYHETPIDWSKTITINTDLSEGASYYIGSQAFIESYAHVILFSGASAHMGNPQDIQVQLERVTIEWPNHPPEKPSTPSGPSEGIVGEEYTFMTSAIDPDGIGDSLWYKWSWGDGTTSEWLGPYNSGVTCEASHTWAEEGNYEIKVKAKDTHNAESPWSDGKWISISESNHPPNTPNIVGEKHGHPGTEYTYAALTTDPDGDDVYYWFYWDDGTNSGWKGPYDSGRLGFAKKSWSNNGVYDVKVKAKDDPNGDGDHSDGLESGWSPAITVTIDDEPDPATIEITYPEVGHWCTERICIPVGILEGLNWGLVRASRLKCETETTGSIDKVVFYVECITGYSDEQTDESPPFECIFRSNLPNALAYTITATAYYNNQNVAMDEVGPICFWKK